MWSRRANLALFSQDALQGAWRRTAAFKRRASAANPGGSSDITGGSSNEPRVALRSACGMYVSSMRLGFAGVSPSSEKRVTDGVALVLMTKLSTQNPLNEGTEATSNSTWTAIPTNGASENSTGRNVVAFHAEPCGSSRQSPALHFDQPCKLQHPHDAAVARSHLASVGTPHC